jgi:hypothetical protein
MRKVGVNKVAVLGLSCVAALREQQQHMHSAPVRQKRMTGLI